MNLKKIHTIIQNEYQQELKLYAKYHNNYLNWLLHTICIPLESLFFLIMICYLFQSALIVTLISIIIAVYYLMLSRPHSLPASISYIIMCYIASSVKTFKHVWIIAIFIETIAWSLQVFIGHYYLNRNKPSMGERITFNSIILSVMLSWDSSIFIDS